VITDSNTSRWNNKCLVTGSAGFIGFHIAQRLLREGYSVIGIDNLNDYYEVSLKEHRLSILNKEHDFTFVKGSIADANTVIHLFKEYRPSIVINLAAQAGVRYSLENPIIYIESNITGFINLLEAIRNYNVKHFIYASSSSVYGMNSIVPYSESDQVNEPMSFYAVTKRTNELSAYAYSHLFGIPSTGLRLFTVYGPLGRPDMAYYSFLNNHFSNKPITIYNNKDTPENIMRDFTYIDDVVESILRIIPLPPQGKIPTAIYNIGNSMPIELLNFISSLEKALSASLSEDIRFKKVYVNRKPGDVIQTFAHSEALQNLIGYKPSTTLDEGLKLFSDWYVDYYGLKK